MQTSANGNGTPGVSSLGLAGKEKRWWSRIPWVWLGVCSSSLSSAGLPQVSVRHPTGLACKVCAHEGATVPSMQASPEKLHTVVCEARQASRRALKIESTAATWLILPVVICLSQRLSHACVGITCIPENCEWLGKSVIVYLIVQLLG